MCRYAKCCRRFCLCLCRFFLQLIIIGHLKLYLLNSSVKYVNFRKNEPFVYTCNRYEKYIPQVGAKIKKDSSALSLEYYFSFLFCTAALLAAQVWKWGGFVDFSEFVIAGLWNAKTAWRAKSIWLSFMEKFAKYILLNMRFW